MSCIMYGQNGKVATTAKTNNPMTNSNSGPSFPLVLGRTVFEVRSFWEVRSSVLEDELKVRKVQSSILGGDWRALLRSCLKV